MFVYLYFSDSAFKNLCTELWGFLTKLYSSLTVSQCIVCIAGRFVANS